VKLISNMKIFNILVSVLLTLAAAEFEKEDGIILMTDDNFDQVVRSDPKGNGIMVMFHASWW